ncbi:MAG: hypothetical protein IKS88_00745, partial [Clostridia bacterium]|nr:hypothetical protein [Clostridia bacterium]
MKKTLSLILLIALLVMLPAALFGCGGSAADGIKGIYMTSAGVILVSDEKLAVKVYDRHGELIYDKLAKINTDAYQLPDICVSGKNAYILEFEKLAEISAEGSYKCRYSVKGESSYIEHTYIVSATPAE